MIEHNLIDKKLWLSDLQLTLYYHWKNVIDNVENSIVNVEKIMKNAKNQDNNEDDNI